MKGNRRVDTKPELAVRSLLHRRGLRFRKDYFLPVPGARGVRADLAFTRQRLAIFIDGCFWHGCPTHGHVPKRNGHYWTPKLERNAARDQLVSDRLPSTGWTVLRFWEHDSPAEIADEIERVALARGQG